MSTSPPDSTIARVAALDEHPCMVCGAVGTAAAIVYPDAQDPPVALCRSCAADRERLAVLVRYIRSLPSSPSGDAASGHPPASAPMVPIVR